MTETKIRKISDINDRCIPPEDFFMPDAVCAIDGVQTSKACRFMICIKLANFYPH